MHYFLFFIVFAIAHLTVSAKEMKPLGTIIQFASIEKGHALLGAEDAYTAQWSKFDIQSRLQKKKGTKAELIQFCKAQVLGWTVDEEQKIRETFAHIDAVVKANGFYWPLPQKVFLIKSTLREEGGALGYTRENYIVLRQDVIFRDDQKLKEILLHEIFHVLTRNSPEYRKQFYDIIGFTVGSPIAYPTELADHKITNPDAHANDSYISLKDTLGREFNAVMILYADEDYDGGLFFQYIQIGFLELVEDNPQQMRLKNGKAIVHSIGAISNFLDQVGKNTQYIIDPEEIMADNFAYAFAPYDKLPNKEIVEEVITILSAH